MLNLAGPIRMRHAGPESACDEGQMRIPIAGLHSTLSRVEILPAFQPVVRIAGVFRGRSGARPRRRLRPAPARDASASDGRGSRPSCAATSRGSADTRPGPHAGPLPAAISTRPRRNGRGQRRPGSGRGDRKPPPSPYGLAHHEAATAYGVGRWPSGVPTTTTRRRNANTLMASHDGSSSDRRRLNLGERGKAWWLLCRLSPPVSQASTREL